MSKKSQKKKQEKVIEDRTFGLKNKNKSKAVQKYVKGVESTVKNQGKSISQLESEEYERKKLRKKEEEEEALLASMFKAVKQEDREDSDSDFDSDDGTDPKTRVCPYFKQGLCNKGRNCKYSHDMTMEKGKDLDLHIDQRTQLIMNGEEDVYFDEDKLLKLIEEKSRVYTKQKPTEIVCRYFLDAVEKKKYNWNWLCPNGMGCHYRHCLPPGYSIKSGKKKMDSDLPVESEIDEVRERMETSKGTPVTLQRFLKWKEDKRIKRELEEQAQRKEEEKKAKHGKQHMLSGRALFEYDAALFVDDEEAVDDNKIYLERVEEEEKEEEAGEALWEGEPQEEQQEDEQDAEEEDETNEQND